MTVCLQDFQVIRPAFEIKQDQILDWIVRAHTQARMKLNKWKEADSECLEFSQKLRENLFKLGFGENKIKNRGIHIGDCHHLDWEKMQIYNLEFAPEGYQLDKRMEFFDQASLDVFKRFYPEDKNLPSHLIHTTCTGYVAPSPAQKLVASRSVGIDCLVTNAYHMGCYAAIPSIRIAMGHYFANKETTDIVHTEFGSLHMNPTKHTTEQLVIQSLFADGFIKYSLKSEEVSASPSFKILAIQEQVVNNSETKMTWVCHPWGFQMSIAKDVPILIQRALQAYLHRLAKRAGREISDLQNAYYAIHPGGPKIIDQTAEVLQLSEKQIHYSKEVLQTCGNMSSATLPHVWDKMLKDETMPKGSLVVSLAFGPGLNISGALFEKG